MTQEILETQALGPQTVEHETYDTPTLIFHWVTALLVVALFGTSFIWNTWPRDRSLRPLMESTHVSLGILFAALFVARLAWRFTGSRRVAAELGISSVLSRAVYVLFYLLLTLQVTLGFVLRWVQGEEFAFFGLFSIPNPIGENRALEHPVENLHNWVAWTIIALAAGHAAAALFHHYVLKDQVLGRMLFRRPVSAAGEGS
jgi:cytochrome b561